MNITEYSVQELKGSETEKFNGGSFTIFVSGIMIGIMLNEIYHDSHPYR